jgi:hypothetical protein
MSLIKHEHLIAINYNEYLIVGFPLSINDSKYERNAFLFNLCFCFSKSNECFYSWAPLVVKAGVYLQHIQLESEYFSKQKMNSTLNCIPFNLILKQVMNDLNIFKECQVPLDSINSLNLKINPNRKMIDYPIDIHNYDVPILLINIHENEMKLWDPTVVRVFNFIDGIKTVHEISQLSEISLFRVVSCLKHLLFFDIISILDSFQLSNIYTLTPKINDLLLESSLLDSCRKYLCYGI